MSSPTPAPTVLIVEDDVELAGTLADVLTTEGFKILHCSKISDANQKLSNQKFSCILLDMKLEQGTGDMVIEAIRKDKGHFNFRTPVLVVSGHLTPETLAKIKSEIQGVLVKPFDIKTLVGRVQALLGVKKAPQKA
jgi:DNA-binding response OmpR family regulator